MKILLDTNVVLDVLQKRSPWFEDGKEIFLAVAANQIDGFVTAREVADIHFFSRKQFRGEENIDQKVRKIISGILALFDIVDTLGEDCRNAFGIENNDYEDAIMISSVQRAGMDYIVTRNTEHFAKSPVPVCPARSNLSQSSQLFNARSFSPLSHSMFSGFPTIPFHPSPRAHSRKEADVSSSPLYMFRIKSK